MTEIAIICTTFYQSIDDWRFKLALEMIGEAKKYYVKFYAIDASINQSINQSMSQAGAIVVSENHANKGKGKGFAYRFGIQYVMDQHNESINQSINQQSQSIDQSINQSISQSSNLILCICEPEKVDFVRFLPTLAELMTHSIDQSTNQSVNQSINQPMTGRIILPRRTKISWDSLPFEQYHSEMLGNRHLDNLSITLNQSINQSINQSTKQSVNRSASQSTTQSINQSVGQSINQSIDLQGIDWLFGPVVFHSSMAHFYLNYAGAAWDAQIVPYINAWSTDQSINQSVIQSVDIDYIHPLVQREHEEFTLEYSSKRLHQLATIIPVVQKSIEQAYQRRKMAIDQSINQSIDQ